MKTIKIGPIQASFCLKIEERKVGSEKDGKEMAAQATQMIIGHFLSFL